MTGDAGMGGVGDRGGGGDGGDGGDGGEAGCVDTSPSVDDDFDGFTNDEGDCDDCDPLSNPQGVEFPTVGGEIPADENCDGTYDEPQPICDAGMNIAPGSATEAANALDICKSSSGPGDWGLVDARWTRADGALLTAGPGLSAGLSSQFGVNINPQLGNRMLVLSTGHARDIDDPDPCGLESCDLQRQGTVLSGFPQTVGTCETGTSINDDIALEVVLRAPSNVSGLRFNSAFASLEFPDYVCSLFNDQFLALVDPPVPGAVNGNVIFDAFDAPPSSLFDILDHCDPTQDMLYATNCSMVPCPSPPMPYCPEGTGLFIGTGFDVWSTSGSGGTGWLETIVPVIPQSEFTVRFTIFDVTDFAFDSTVWIDAVGWEAVANAAPETYELINPN